jgi:hypothetical protein
MRCDVCNTTTSIASVRNDSGGELCWMCFLAARQEAVDYQDRAQGSRGAPCGAVRGKVTRKPRSKRVSQPSASEGLYGETDK